MLPKAKHSLMAFSRHLVTAQGLACLFAFFLFCWQSAAGLSLNCASCRCGLDESFCPRSATEIHSVVMDRTPNLPTGRRTLYHWANAVLKCFTAFLFRNEKKTWWVAAHTVAELAFQICNCRYTRKKSSAGTDKKRRYRRSDDKAEPWCTWKIGNMPGPTKLRRYITEVITGEFYCAKWLFISSLCGNCGKFDAYYKKNPILSLSPGILVKPWSKLSHLQLDWRLTNRWKTPASGRLVSFGISRKDWS